MSLEVKMVRIETAMYTAKKSFTPSVLALAKA